LAHYIPLQKHLLFGCEQHFVCKSGTESLEQFLMSQGFSVTQRSRIEKRTTFLFYFLEQKASAKV